MVIQTKDFYLNLSQGRLRARSIQHTQGNVNSRPVLVFLHEGLGCISMWKDFPEEISKQTGFDALVFDRIGHGKSDSLLSVEKDTEYLDRESFLHLPEVLEACCIDTPFFIGHSDGGTIALKYTAKFPQTVAGVISIAAHTFVDNLTIQGIANAKSNYQSNGLKTKLINHHGNNIDPVFYRWANTWLSDDHFTWNMISELTSITCPVLAVQGIDDHYGTEAQADSIIRAVSGYSEKIMIPDCGHVPHHEKRHLIIDLITAFIINQMQSECIT